MKNEWMRLLDILLLVVLVVVRHEIGQQILRSHNWPKRHVVQWSYMPQKIMGYLG